MSKSIFEINKSLLVEQGARVKGKLLIDQKATIKGDLEVHGNLILSGTITKTNITQLHTAEKVLVLNSGSGASATRDKAGISIEGGSLGDINFLFNETTDRMELNEGLSLAKTLKMETGANIEMTGIGTVDGVDVSVLKSDYDAFAAGTFIRTTEEVQDIAGGMIGTKGNIAVDYVDGGVGLGKINYSVANSTTTTKGVVELATQAETITGTNTTLATTPLGVSASIASGIANLPTPRTEEQVEDIVGAMLGGTETGITVTYQDVTGDIDFVVTPASETVAGIVERATPAEAVTGTDNSRFITPLQLKVEIDKVPTPKTTEQIEDVVGAMFTGNTETGITVTYQDATNDIDLVVTEASETVKGIAERATILETTTGTDTTRFVTPAGVSASIAALPAGSDTTYDFNVTAGGANSAILNLVASAGDSDLVTFAGNGAINITETTGDAATITIGIDAASATQAGVVELATLAETNTGTATNRAVTPDVLEGSYYTKAIVGTFTDSTSPVNIIQGGVTVGNVRKLADINATDAVGDTQTYNVWQIEMGGANIGCMGSWGSQDGASYNPIEFNQQSSAGIMQIIANANFYNAADNWRVIFN